MDMMSYLMGRNSSGAKKGAKIEVVTELPEIGEANVIYLVPKETEDENNVFDEYLYINDEWELIGTTDIDLSGYQPLLTAGDNITINNNVISAKANEPYFLGNIADYTQQNPLDIQKLHVGYQYVIATPQFGKPQLSDLWVKVVYKGEEIVQKISVTSTDVHTHREIKLMMYKEINDDYSGYETIFGVSYCTVHTAGTEFVDAKQTQVAFNSSTKTFGTTTTGSTLYAVTSDTSQSITAKKTFTVLPESSVVPTTDNQLTNKKYVDDNKGQTIQYETMPTANADYLGKIVQYIGTTNANYTNGYFYVCVGATENDVTTYSWSNVEVQNNDDIFVFVDEDTTGRSVSSLNSIPENKEKLKRLGQVILDGKVPAVFFKRKGYHSSGGTYPIHPTLYYWNVDNDKIYFTFEIIYPNRSGSYIYYYEVQYGTTQDTQYLATSYPNGTNSSFGSKSTTNSLVPKNVGTEIYRYPISSQYFNWTLDLERYSSSKTYQIGDYIVSYNSNTTMPSQMCILYKCNTADTTGNWDSSKWTQTTYMEYLSDKLVGGALNGSY